MDILLKIATTILAPFLFIGASLGTMIAPEPVVAPEPVAPLGASQEIPTTIAFFETTLASAINESATTFTLTSAVDKDGTTLASSTYAFVIDEGSSNEEIVIADCTATACINAERGVSARTGNTEVTALKKSHRRGASVKMTDAPALPLITRILRGEGTVDFTPSVGGNLVTKDYVDALSFGGTVPVASLTDDGVAELSTGLEAASSTPTGGSGSPLMLHTGISTSTGGTAYTIPVTDSTGKIGSSFIATTTVTNIAVSYASTTVFTQVYGSTSTSTYTKPANLKFIVVETQAPGGASIGGSSTGSSGAGAGGYTRQTILASALTATTTIVVGTSTTFGSFSTSTAGSNGGNATTPGAGGTGTGGDVNISGESGQGHNLTAGIYGGKGGSSLFGNGGIQTLYGTNQRDGTSGNGYGSGAGGGNRSGGVYNRANGRPGIVIITEYF